MNYDDGYLEDYIDNKIDSMENEDDVVCMAETIIEYVRDAKIRRLAELQ